MASKAEDKVYEGMVRSGIIKEGTPPAKVQWLTSWIHLAGKRYLEKIQELPKELRGESYDRMVKSLKEELEP